MTRACWIVLAATLLAGPAAAARVVAEVRWEKAPPGARVVPRAAGRSFAAIEIARTQKVWVIDGPQLNSGRYAVWVELRYRQVDPPGMLELWSVFEGRKRFFTRTAAGSGPMAALAGDSGWRFAVLPFNAGRLRPRRLELSVVIPGRGTVEVGPLKLVELGPNDDPLAPVDGRGWWSERQAGVIGAVAGTVLGLWGTLLGVLAFRARQQRLVGALAWALVSVGAAALAAGALALVGQPWWVFAPIFLVGAVAACCGGLALALHRRRRATLELRKMRAMEIEGR